MQPKISQTLLFHRNSVARVFMKFIWQSTKWRSDPFDSFIWQPACIPTTFVGRADSPSISTTFVGTAIPTKLVGTVYFENHALFLGSSFYFGLFSFFQLFTFLLSSSYFRGTHFVGLSPSLSLSSFLGSSLFFWSPLFVRLSWGYLYFCGCIYCQNPNLTSTQGWV